jgi:hypothetical protein
MGHPPPPPADAGSKAQANATWHGRAARLRIPLLVLLMLGFVLWAHFGSGVPVFRSDAPAEPGWEQFRADHDVDHFGADGQFTRAVRNGYNLVHHTDRYASRFTRVQPGASATSCSGCHTVEDLAYSFVNSDRIDSRSGVRMSFEDRIRWCYAHSLNGFVPTIYDPAVRDIRLLARAVAHRLGLGEGAKRTGG